MTYWQGGCVHIDSRGIISQKGGENEKKLRTEKRRENVSSPFPLHVHSSYSLPPFFLSISVPPSFLSFIPPLHACTLSLSHTYTHSDTHTMTDAFSLLLLHSPFSQLSLQHWDFCVFSLSAQHTVEPVLHGFSTAPWGKVLILYFSSWHWYPLSIRHVSLQSPVSGGVKKRAMVSEEEEMRQQQI